MAEQTGISWCDHTFNPWWGCGKISAGCHHCYAAAQCERWGVNCFGSVPRRFFGAKHWNEPRRWDRKAKDAGVKRRVFVGSMCDIFEDRAALEAPRQQLWQLIDACPNLIFLLCTKRPENFSRMLPEEWLVHPRANVWLGTTIESSQYIDRYRTLMETPAAIRWVSAEPLLGPIDFGSLFNTYRPCDWVVLGAESRGTNPGRECKTRWVTFAIWDCLRWVVTPFVKQLHIVKDGRTILSKDPAEWPDSVDGVNVRVRNFPEVAP